MASENDKTSTYDESADKNRTQAYGGGASDEQRTSTYAAPSAAAKSRTHGIGAGDKIELRGVSYTIIEIISEGTGEAVIYKISDVDQVFALKLYFEFNNPGDEPNQETLRRIKDINDPDILKMHDFGVGADKYQGKYCYEISDFAEGGDLLAVRDFREKYTASFIEHSMVPEILKGIRKLHQFKIYHCDLKPSNLFYLDRARTNVLIGDYGSAKAYDLATEKEVRKSATVKGTEAYLPPEQARGIVSEKNDYYSFGMVLMHLLYPEQLVTDGNIRVVDKRKFERIIERQYNAQPLIDFHPAHARLNNLIEGLTLVNHLNRFGKKEVEQWERGEFPEVKYKATETSNVQGIKLGYTTIKTGKDFIHVLETKESWHEELIEDPDSYATVKAWIDSYRDIPTRKTVDNMIKFYQPFGKTYLKEFLIRYFDPERPLTIGKDSFNFFTASNIAEEVSRFFAKLDSVYKEISLADMRFHLFQMELSLRQFAKAVGGNSGAIASAIVEKMHIYFDSAQKADEFKTAVVSAFNVKEEAAAFRQIIRLFYGFTKNRGFRDEENKALTSLEDVALYFVRHPDKFDDRHLKVEREVFAEEMKRPELSKLGLKDFVFEVFKNKAESTIELQKLTFDTNRNYVINYKYYKSLNQFLSSKGITQEFTSRSEENEVYHHERRMFQSFGSGFNDFIAGVLRKHSISKLPESNLAELRSRFIRSSWLRYANAFIGQIIALVIIIPLGIFAYDIATHQLHVDENWNFYYMKPAEYYEKIERDKAEAERKAEEERQQLEQYQLLLKEAQIDSFLNHAKVESIKLFASGAVAPEYGARDYKTAFTGSKTLYINFELNLLHKKQIDTLHLDLDYVIYKGKEKFAENTFKTAVRPDWSISYHTAGWGAPTTNYWKKGKYMLEIKYKDRVLGTKNFTIK